MSTMIITKMRNLLKIWEHAKYDLICIAQGGIKSHFVVFENK